MGAVIVGLRLARAALLLVTGGWLQHRSFRHRRMIARRDFPDERQLFAWKNVDVGWDFWIGLFLLVAGLLVLPLGR